MPIQSIDDRRDELLQVIAQQWWAEHSERCGFASSRGPRWPHDGCRWPPPPILRQVAADSGPFWDDKGNITWEWR